MQNIFHALSVVLLIFLPYGIAASVVVIIGLALDLPGHVRKTRGSFRRANKTYADAEHDWESVFPDDPK